MVQKLTKSTLGWKKFYLFQFIRYVSYRAAQFTKCYYHIKKTMAYYSLIETKLPAKQNAQGRTRTDPVIAVTSINFNNSNIPIAGS